MDLVMSNNKFLQGQYLVIQTYPVTRNLRCVFTGFSYNGARDKLDLENLAHDYTSFGLRIVCDHKLYFVKSDGSKGKLSKQQNWQIDSRYLKSDHDKNSEGEILICNCSYPYYAPLVIRSSISEDKAGSQPLTCLVEDNNRVIHNCPNCGKVLLDF